MSVGGFTNEKEALAVLRRMTMPEIRTLAAVKAAGNVSRAAIALGASQPALSQHIRELENKLGVTLFDRHRRGLEPTPFGAVLMRLATSIGADLQIAAGALVRASYEHEAPLRIGSMPVTSGGLLALAVSRFASEANTPSVVLVEGTRDTLLEHLRHARIDVYVGRLEQRASSDLSEEVLFTDGVVVVASATHSVRKRLAPARMEALLGYSWILPAEDASFHEQLTQSFAMANLQLPQARVNTYSTIAIPAMVAHSELLGFLPASLFASGTISSSLERLPVDIVWAPATIGVILHKNDFRQPKVDLFLSMLRKVAASVRAAMLTP